VHASSVNRISALLLVGLIVASCGGSSGTTASSPTIPPTTSAATTTAPTPAPTTAAPTVVATSSTGIAATDCTNPTATTRQVVERLFALSTGNDARAVTDCYAQSYRDKNPNFAASASDWSHQGPATDVVVTPLDVVNGCDRFKAEAKMPNNPFWPGQAYYTVGPEVGRPRIYDTGSGLPVPAATIVRCP
jgi:hypothetical protein